MIQPFKNLGRAIAIDAISHRFAFFVNDRFAAGWALIGIMETLFLAGASFKHRADYLWNNVTGALDHNHVADPNIFAENVVLVMQSGELYRHASQFHRLEHSKRIH